MATNFLIFIFGLYFKRFQIGLHNNIVNEGYKNDNIVFKKSNNMTAYKNRTRILGRASTVPYLQFVFNEL